MVYCNYICNSPLAVELGLISAFGKPKSQPNIPYIFYNFMSVASKYPIFKITADQFLIMIFSSKHLWDKNFCGHIDHGHRRFLAVFFILVLASESSKKSIHKNCENRKYIVPQIFGNLLLILYPQNLIFIFNFVIFWKLLGL